MLHPYRVGFALIIVLLVSLSAAAQSEQTISGRWSWKEVAVRDKPQTQFTLVITRRGSVIRGTYSVDQFINGEWQGEDGNQTAFTGQLKGQSYEIKFDTQATAPGYQRNVIYRAPRDGRQPSVAVLTLTGTTLVWRSVSGERIDGVPESFKMRRVK